MSEAQSIPPMEYRARCASCGYFLTGLPSPGYCPECGRTFDFADPASYLWHEPFVRWRYWLPAIIPALLIIMGGLALDVFVIKAWGWSVWIATPMAGAVLAGYGTHVKGWLGWLFVILLLGCAFICALVSMNQAGAFCGMVLAVILMAPLLAGIWLGLMVRNIAKSSTFSQRWYLPMLVFIALVGCYVVDGRPTPGPVEYVTTRQMVHVSAPEAFDSMMFFEEVRQQPPWILRIGLARPLYTLGSSEQVGDVKTCVYNKGHITKRVTAIVPGQRLDFVVTEQHIGYEHDVDLEGGSFEFISEGSDACIIRLTTTYRPLLTPRFCWRWAERIGVHTLHHHVIDAIALDATLRREGNCAREDGAECDDGDEDQGRTAPTVAMGEPP